MIMLDSDTIRKLFDALNTELKSKGVTGEVGICGGAVMCLVFNSRDSTKDVDGIFKPTEQIREASRAVAAAMGVSEDWLNDAAKAYFLCQPEPQDVLNMSNLRVWAPTAEYMLAMKCMAARFDTHDLEDVRFLIKHLRILNVDRALNIVEKYCPRERIPPKTQFLIEELFE